MRGKVDICVGLQWGDEGKGKIVDYLAKDYQIVGRSQGGPNAGHTLWYEGQRLILHNLPSGILHQDVLNFIGPGCVIDPLSLINEIKDAAQVLGERTGDLKERIFLSKHAFLITPFHRYLDKAIEVSKGATSVGTTGRGIGPAYMDVKSRLGVRIGDPEKPWNQIYEFYMKLLHFYSTKYGYVMPEVQKIIEDFENFKEATQSLNNYVNFVDQFWLQNNLDAGMNVLAEGAQGTMLDNNFGCYPMVTSSNTIASAVPLGLGIPMKYIGKIYGVIKWYTTKVGEGIFPSEIEDKDIQNLLQEAGGEIGATTGRARKCGWLDMPQIIHAIRLNDVNELIITKVDINPLKKISVVEDYFSDDEIINVFSFKQESFQKQLRNFNADWSSYQGSEVLKSNFGFYLNYIENAVQRLGVKVSYISHGPGRDDITKL